MKVAIFDFDGTIFDSAKYWTQVCSGYLEDNNVEVPKDIFTITKPLGIRGSVVEFNKRYGLKHDVDEVTQNWCDIMKIKYHEEIPLKKNSEKYLAKLKAQGIKICLATAMENDFVDGAIDRCDIRKYFDFIVTISDINTDKSTPKIYEVCAEKFNATEAECTVFEDSPHSVKMCHEAGFKVVGVYDGVSKGDIDKMKECADKVIFEFDELL